MKNKFFEGFSKEYNKKSMRKLRKIGYWNFVLTRGVLYFGILFGSLMWLFSGNFSLANFPIYYLFGQITGFFWGIMTWSFTKFLAERSN